MTRIVEKIELYSLQPDSLKFAEPLTGSHEYRLRVGDYNIPPFTRQARGQSLRSALPQRRHDPGDQARQ